MFTVDIQSTSLVTYICYAEILYIHMGKRINIKINPIISFGVISVGPRNLMDILQYTSTRRVGWGGGRPGSLMQEKKYSSGFEQTAWGN